MQLRPANFESKVVIFPHLNKPLPLTPLSELRAVLPTVDSEDYFLAGAWRFCRM
jgi:hypothetical protein